MSIDVKIIGTGTYLPGDPVPFDDIGTVLGDIPDAPKRVRKWMHEINPVMKEMLGVEYYHYAYDPATKTFRDDQVSMAVKAAQGALAAAGMSPSDIDLICYGSSSQAQMPTTSVRIQEALGIDQCSEFSIHANCTSAYKALYVATEMIRSGNYKTALVVSSQLSSGITVSDFYNQKVLDRETVLLRWFLCDGAGALVLTSRETDKPYLAVENNFLESIGGKRHAVMYNKMPAHPVKLADQYEQGMHHISQTFQNALSSGVFKDDSRSDRSIIYCGLDRMVRKFDIDLSGLKYLQINLPNKHAVEKLIDEFQELGIERSKLYSKLDTLGYCGPPMVFICVDQIMRQEPLRDGDMILSFVTEVSKFMQAGFTLRARGFQREQ